MATPEQIDAVIARYGQQHAAVRDRILAYVRAQWGRLESFRDADIERLIETLIPAVTAALTQTAAITDAQLAAVETVVTGVAVRPVGIPAAAVSHPAMRGVGARDLYQRVGQTVWWELSKGADIERAATRGLERLERITTTDLQLAKTHTARLAMSTKLNVVGYRRVLSGSENCNLCRVASTQRYRTDQLMPIHSGCDCGIRAIYGVNDPGRVIDRDLLDEIKAEQREGKAPRTKVVEHAEIGPQLVDASHAVKPRSRLTPAAQRQAKRSAELRERWAENLAAARANGGVIEVDPKTLRPILRAA